MLKSTVKLLLRGAIGAITEVCNLSTGLFLLSRARPSLAGTQTVVIYYDGGFGHSIIGPDALRRLHPGKSAALVWFREAERHNLYSAALWQDVRVIVLPVLLAGSLGRKAGWSAVPQKRRLASIYSRLLRRWLPNAALTTVDEFWDALPSAGPPMASFAKERDYFALCKAVPAPPVRLPPGIREKVRAKVVATCGERPVCCLYLRHRVTGFAETDRRSGVPFDAMQPAVELLIDRGWVVLVTGDRPVPKPMLRRHPAELLDAATAGVELPLFNLYAQSEAELFIGDSGGGVWLPAINFVPMLLVNTFPLDWGMPGATVLWKVPLDSDRRPIPSQLAMAQLASDHAAQEVEVRENTPEELLYAVNDVLDWLDAGRPIPQTPLFDALPDGALLRTIAVRPSPAWPCLSAATG